MKRNVTAVLASVVRRVLWKSLKPWPFPKSQGATTSERAEGLLDFSSQKVNVRLLGSLRLCWSQHELQEPGHMHIIHSQESANHWIHTQKDAH